MSPVFTSKFFSPKLSLSSLTLLPSASAIADLDMATRDDDEATETEAGASHGEEELILTELDGKFFLPFLPPPSLSLCHSSSPHFLPNPPPTTFSCLALYRSTHA